MFFRRKKSPFDPNVVLGAEVAYKVPMEGGWRVLQGNIVNLTDTAVVVREKYFGGKSTIDPTWVIGFVWEMPVHETTPAFARV